jgi:ribosomal protein S18 acetylase RimI-like enzyme
LRVSVFVPWWLISFPDQVADLSITLFNHAKRMFEIKPMNTCSFQTAHEVWNEGFKGYFVDLTLPLDGFLQRLSYENISPEHSLIAFDEKRPVGFLLNAFRNSRGRKIACNAGTGVVPDMRGKGVGKALVSAAIEVYKSESVDVALLEAVQGNDSAIALYQKNGYQVIDELTNLQSDNSTSLLRTQTSYTVRQVHPADVGKLNFYYERSAWQTQWQSIGSTCGLAITVSDETGSAVAYALFRKKFDDQGKLLSVVLCQCEVAPGLDDQENVASVALDAVFPAGAYRRATHDFRKSNRLIINKLLDAGFTTFIEQFHMMKTISELQI